MLPTLPGLPERQRARPLRFRLLPEPSEDVGCDIYNLACHCDADQDRGGEVLSIATGLDTDGDAVFRSSTDRCGQLPVRTAWQACRETSLTGSSGGTSVNATTAAPPGSCSRRRRRSATQPPLRYPLAAVLPGLTDPAVPQPGRLRRGHHPGPVHLAHHLRRPPIHHPRSVPAGAQSGRRSVTARRCRYRGRLRYRHRQLRPARPLVCRSDRAGRREFHDHPLRFTLRHVRHADRPAPPAHDRHRTPAAPGRHEEPHPGWCTAGRRHRRCLPRLRHHAARRVPRRRTRRHHRRWSRPVHHRLATGTGRAHRRPVDDVDHGRGRAPHATPQQTTTGPGRRRHRPGRRPDHRLPHHQGATRRGELHRPLHHRQPGGTAGCTDVAELPWDLLRLDERGLRLPRRRPGRRCHRDGIGRPVERR